MSQCLVASRGAQSFSGARRQPESPKTPTTITKHDPRLRHSLPAIKAVPIPEGVDPLLPTTAKGVAAAQRAGAKRDNRVVVSVRVRPPTKADGGVSEVAVQPEGATGVCITKPNGFDQQSFAYDHVFQAGQEEVFDCIGRPMLQSAFEGYNVTLFAYGQTGSGKTHSIMGPGPNCAPADEGFVPRFFRALLQQSQVALAKDATLSVRLTMGMAEVYNEEIRDLLGQKGAGQSDLPVLELREDSQRRVYIENLSTHTLLSYDRFAELLQKGFDSRKVAATAMNERSSRSHSIVILHLLQKHEAPGARARDLESTINIVDLAGSERQGKTGVTGEQLLQAKNINLSLMTLGKVLTCLSEGRGLPPLRDSKLTRILGDSFGGNARTWMLACVSASSYNYQESLSTLSFAASAKKIVNKASANVALQKVEDREKIRQLQLELQERMQEIQQLKGELETLRAASGAPPLSPADGFGLLAGEGAGCGGNLFIGRAKLSLKNCVLQYRCHTTLPLVVQRPEHDGATLTVTTYPMTDEEEPLPEYSDVATAVAALTGKRFDFCVHVLGADGIPAEFSTRVICRYVFAKKERKPMTTIDALDTTAPRWDYLKRFAWIEFDQIIADNLCSDVLTFEVIGYPRPITP